MSKTAIEWTDETWNPVTGCKPISPGCGLCYAKTLHDMRHKAWKDGWKDAPPQYHEPFETVMIHEDRLDALPLKGKPRRVFVNSMSDLFHKDVPREFIHKVFVAMSHRPHMTFQILTKRPERMCEFMTNWVSDHGGWRDAKGPPSNVWLGVSVENQKYADERIPWLLKTPAAVRFLSCEPLLGPLDLWKIPRLYESDIINYDSLEGRWHDKGEFSPVYASERINWVIVGGESGDEARPMHPDWARSLRDQCQAAKVPYFFKQWGAWREPKGREEYNTAHGRAGKPPAFIVGSDGIVECFVRDHTPNPCVMIKRPSEVEHLDGREWHEFPEVAHA